MRRIASVLLLFFCSQFLFSCEKETLLESETESIIISYDDLENHPEIILEAYKTAYPTKIENVAYMFGDWAIEMVDGKVFFWAHGRLLNDSKRAQWQEYAPYQIYPYTGNPRNPQDYTDEHIAHLRFEGSEESRLDSGLPQDDDFFNALFRTETRGSTENQIETLYIFGGFKVNVHEDIAPALQRVNDKYMALIKNDEVLKSFLTTTLNRVDGYNWRLIEGTDRRSNHSYGLAVDILPNYWGSKDMYWSWVRDDGVDWVLFPQEDLWTPPQELIDIFKEEGFIWGGTWDFYDTMHFEYRPELIELSKKCLP